MNSSFYVKVKNSTLSIYETMDGSLNLEIDSEGRYEDICSSIEISEDYIRGMIKKLSNFLSENKSDKGEIC